MSYSFERSGTLPSSTYFPLSSDSLKAKFCTEMTGTGIYEAWVSFLVLTLSY